MQKLFLTFLFLFLCNISIHAQKLNVESFVAKSNDITARTQPRKDINGNDCALVKVRLATNKALFSGNVVGNVDYNTSEYLVYMAQGSKRLTIKLEGYLPLDVSFQEYSINSLEGKTVYVLTLSGVTGIQQLEAPQIKTGWVILDSEPSGASVYINDEFVGNTPLGNYKQAYGTYQYRLEHPNYHSSTGTIELNAGRFEQKVILKPAFGSISVNSSIAGAKILLDGKQTGKQTPAMLTEMPSGTHTITLQMDKYAPIQQEVIVEDGKTANVSMALDARFARITINSLDGAVIYSNGKFIGKGRFSEDMMEGYYNLEARLDHHKTATKQIQVTAGQAQEITLNPIPKYGSIDVISEPRDATVEIDGKEYGKTPSTIESLLEGQHQILIRLGGYADYKSTINIKGNENATITAKLSNLINIKITSNNPNATLYIDGVEQGLASGIKSVSLGQHQIRLSATEWKDYITTINATTSQTTFNFKMEETDSPYRIIKVGNVSFKMIRVEWCRFSMGGTADQGNFVNEDTKPVHYVNLDTYYIGETEVTQELWEAVMSANPSHFKDPKRPVEEVSWDDCQQFIAKLNSLTGRNFRLPTEAEWECAARGCLTGGYMYAGNNNEDFVAWYDRNSYRMYQSDPNYGTHKVKTKSPNRLRIYDMSGNVREWCQDFYGEYSSMDQVNPTGPQSGQTHVIRGGGFTDENYKCKVSYRDSEMSEHKSCDLGLRLAL